MKKDVISEPEAGRLRLWSRRGLKRMSEAAPVARHAPKNPVLLIGAVAAGVAGALAWTNRRRIAEAARLMLENAASRGHAMRQRLPWVRDAGAAAGTRESLH